MKVGAIILSGGKSSRMGTNKALLKINEKTNIDRIINQLRGFQEIILVTNEPKEYEFLHIKMVTDQYPGKGPLAGLHAGLLASPYDVNLVVACDMPFVTSDLAHSLIGNIGDKDAVIPVINGQQHPLFSVFRKRVVQKIEDCIVNDRLSMKQLLKELRVHYMNEHDLNKFSVDVLNRIFFNMNEPAEYESAKKWAKESSL